jgi:small subunit ribosomal protein S17
MADALNPPAGEQPAKDSGAARQGRKEPRSIDGVVVSAKSPKTIAVEAERLEKHPKYGKYIRRHIRFRAHDEKSEAREGDVVRIVQTRPISKTKRWRLVQVISRSKGAAVTTV